MDTLVVVKKIREADQLADAGRHDDATTMLNELLASDLGAPQRTIIQRKLDVLNRRKERETRIMSRRNSSVLNRSRETTTAPLERETPDNSDETSETARATAISDTNRKITDKVDPPENIKDTIVRMRESARMRAVDSQIMDAAIPDEDRVIDASDSQPLAPVSTDSRDSGRLDSSDDSTNQAVAASSQDSQELAPVADDDLATESDDARDSGLFPEVSDSQIAVSGKDLDTDFLPQPDPEETPTHQQPILKDSVVQPIADEPEVESDYFEFYSSKDTAAGRSNPELKAIADRLPDDDLRRELAMEVVRLREQVKNLEHSTRTVPAPAPAPTITSPDDAYSKKKTRRLHRGNKPESGEYRIPANQVNTIVRTAAGSSDIAVHFVSNDEDFEGYEVLRRDSVKEKATPASKEESDRIALAEDYIGTSDAPQTNRLRPLLMLLLALVILGIIGWGIWYAVQVVNAANMPKAEITETGIGDFELGKLYTDYDELRAAEINPMRQSLRTQSNRWLIQFDEKDRIRAISIPADDPEHTHVQFGPSSLSLRDGSSVKDVKRAFGEPIRDLSPSLLAQSKSGVLRFESRQGDRALEFHYIDGNANQAVWIRLIDTQNEPEAPKLD